MNYEILDFPTAWELCKTSAFPHDPKCSYIVSMGALLCDCGAVRCEWDRLRKAKADDFRSHTCVELAPGELHPAAHEALRWIQSLPANTLMQFVEAYSSCAISGENKLAEVCAETLRRLLNHEAVSDRYLMGLAWSMRHIGDLSARFRGIDSAPATDTEEAV